MKLLLVTCIILWLCLGGFIGYAQTPYFNKVWEKEFGGYDRESALNNDLSMSKDSMFYFVATSETMGKNGNKTVRNCGNDSTPQHGDVWLFKFDQQGNKIWDNTLGGKQGELAYCITILNNSDIIIGGGSGSNINCEKSEAPYQFGYSDYWVIETDTSGQKIWDKRLGYLSWFEDVRQILEIPGGDLLVIGTSGQSGIGGDLTDTCHGFSDLWIVKLDSLGNKKWDKMIGSNGEEYPIGLINTSNNTFYLTASTSANSPSWELTQQTHGGLYDGWLLKMDTAANIIWQKVYGGLDYEFITKMYEKTNGDLIIAACLSPTSKGGDITDSISRGNWDTWIIHTDSMGNILNDKRLGGNCADMPISIHPLSDGGFLLVDRSCSDAGFEKSENSKGGDDVWIVKLDSNLNIQWDKTIGGTWDEYSSSLYLLNDTTFILACTTGSQVGGDKALPLFDTIAQNYGASDVWITKWVFSNWPMAISENELPNAFNVFPNPASNVISISPFKMFEKNTSVVITDIQGKIIYEQKIDMPSSNQISISIEDYSLGVYLLRVGNAVKRFVKI